MRALRHKLTPLFTTLLLLGASACEAPKDAADGGDSAGYALCDGSDDIRLAYQSGGGRVEDGYHFLNIYGREFLYVDGHCNFIAAEYREEPDGAFVSGHLSDDAAAEIKRLLELDELPTGSFLGGQGCSDAGGVSIATAQFYGGCRCGCSPGTPAALEQALAQTNAALTLVRAQGAAYSGEVEVAATKYGEGRERDAQDWPFSWSIDEIVNVRFSDESKEVKLRVLSEEDAETARRLRGEAHNQARDMRLFVVSEGSSYVLYVRDRVEPEIGERIRRFNEEAFYR